MVYFACKSLRSVLFALLVLDSTLVETGLPSNDLTRQQEAINLVLKTEDLFKNLTPNQKKIKYHELLLLLHPDKCKLPQATEATQRLNKAYDVKPGSTAQQIHGSFESQGHDGQSRYADYPQQPNGHHQGYTNHPPHYSRQPPWYTGHSSEHSGYYPNQSRYPHEHSGYYPNQSGYPHEHSGYYPNQSGYPHEHSGYYPNQSGYYHNPQASPSNTSETYFEYSPQNDQYTNSDYDNFKTVPDQFPTDFHQKNQENWDRLSKFFGYYR